MHNLGQAVGLRAFVHLRHQVVRQTIGQLRPRVLVIGAVPQIVRLSDVVF